MCQLALGHYFLQARGDPIDIWHDTTAFGDALVALQGHYRFDGILVNLPGRDPHWRRWIDRIDAARDRRIIQWRGSSRRTIVVPDDNPHVVDAAGREPHPAFADVDPDNLFYVEPFDTAGLTYPQAWGFGAEPATPGPGFFPPWQWDTVRYVRALTPDVSLHAEVFSPFSQLVDLLGLEAAMVALVDDPAKVHACLDRLADGAAALACGHFAAGADAVLISSAYAGAGFISPRHYETFVLPYERKVIAIVKAPSLDRPVYTHTCGAIGDRLELMEGTCTDGIDTLDPPPLGTVDLAAAKRALDGRVFIKGNVDPVNTILRGTPDDCYRDARERIRIASPGGGYILSTACSVPPHAPPKNIEQLARAAEEAAA
jgi:uroporphyrinogen decarboxylase-like protein